MDVSFTGREINYINIMARSLGINAKTKPRLTSWFARNDIKSFPKSLMEVPLFQIRLVLYVPFHFYILQYKHVHEKYEFEMPLGDAQRP